MLNIIALGVSVFKDCTAEEIAELKGEKKNWWQRILEWFKNVLK